MSLADLQDDEVAFRKFKLVAEEVQGKYLLTNFHGMTMTTDKLRSLVKKWQVNYCTVSCHVKCRGVPIYQIENICCRYGKIFSIGNRYFLNCTDTSTDILHKH